MKFKNLMKAVGLGALGYAPASGFYLLGLEFMNAGLACVLLYTYPIFVVLISTFKLNKTITKWIILALTFVLTGIILITKINPRTINPWGILIVLCASIIYSIYIIISKKTLSKINTNLLTVYILSGAAISFFFLGITTNQLSLFLDLHGWFCIIAISIVSTALPVFAFFSGLSKIKSNQAGILSSIEPAFALILGVAILEEQPTFISLIGIILIFIGIAIVLKRNKRRT